MHDVGKIGVRYDMLNKPGKLTPEEVAVFRQHPEKGKRILEPVPCLHGLIDGCYCHHEWWDGGGYPRGLAGHAIPLVGRVVAIADAYDAMTSDRAYRRALPHEVAIGEIDRCAGTQFNPELADAFVKLMEQWRKRMRDAGRDTLIPRSAGRSRCSIFRNFPLTSIALTGSQSSRTYPIIQGTRPMLVT